MKQIAKFTGLIVLALTALASQARTIHINASSYRGDLTMQLREACARATYSDTVVLNFDKGTYTIDGTITCKCHVIIKGSGQDKSTIIIDNGKDRRGLKAFTDDCFFHVYGTLKHPISLSISDISFKIKDHKGIWWKDMERYIVKVYHANYVNIHDVYSYLANAKATNFDLHVCSNVTISDCVVTNYNNCDTGGNLWIRGEMHNINVKNNVFNKYGADEALAVYDRLVDNSKAYVRGKAVRSDIFIEDNEFYYGGYKGNGKDPEANCDMIFSLFTHQDNSKDMCLTSNFHLRGNKFYINDVTTRCMYISFDPADVHSDIYIENNEIINNALNRDYKFYHKDIELHDLSACGDTIHITGNSVRNKALVLNSSGSTGYMFLQTRGGIASVTGNQIVNELTTDRRTGKSYGMQLIWCQAEGGDVTLKNNVCKGLSHIAYVGGGDGTPLFKLNASNNYFEGDTRIYSHKIKEMILNFTGNTFKSNNRNFFLQEFADKGSVVFNYNDVTVTSGDGQFMTHWGKNSTNSMRFDKLELKGNVFKGVKSESDMLRNITNVKKRKISSNRTTR